MQDLELISKDFVICDECRVISTDVMRDSKKNPVKSYRIAHIIGNDFYKIGDRVIVAGEGARIKLRDNPAEYWMFDVNAVIGKVGK